MVTSEDGAPALALPTARDDVVLRRIGSEWVLFDPANDRAHVFNLTAAVVWTYCDGRHDPQAMASAIAGATGAADSDSIRADIEAVIRRFAAEGLLR